MEYSLVTLETYFVSMRPAVPTGAIITAATMLLSRTNPLLDDLQDAGIAAASVRRVNSGWRTPTHNASVPNASPTSKHMTGEAIDIGDPDAELDDYLFTEWQRNPDGCLLVRHGLYMEHPASTKGWCHVQSVAPRSGNRVFYP